MNDSMSYTKIIGTIVEYKNCQKFLGIFVHLLLFLCLPLLYIILFKAMQF